MAPKELVELSKRLKGLCRYEPKGKKLSIQAKVYAVIRFIQEGEGIMKRQAWIDTVARQGQRDFEQLRKEGRESTPEELRAIEAAFIAGDMDLARQLAGGG